MTVGIVGSGPAAAAVEAALGDVDIETSAADVETFGDADLTVVVGQVGDTVFERASEQALSDDVRWLAVELGGVGGIPIVDAAVTGFSPDTGCYECLSGRVTANLDPKAEPAAAPDDYTARFAGAVAGREAARFVAEDADIFGRVVEIPFTERTFLPLPNCPCERKRDRQLDRAYTDRSIEESLARAERALDEQLGIVQEVGEAESYPIPYYLAQNCDTSGFSDVSAAREAAGVATDWNAAFMKALGESLERYAAGVYHAETFTRGSPEAVDSAVDPADFVCETEPEGESIHWVPGEHLSTGEHVQLPAEFVHYPPPEKRFRPAITTGLGLGNSSVEAVLSGLYEVIERDASMLSWHSSFDPLALAIDDDGYERLVTRAASEGLSVTPLLVTMDVDVPVVAVAVHRDEWPKFAVGSSADLDVVAAAKSGLSEALQNWMELRGMGPDDAETAMGAIGKYADEPGPAEAFIDAETTIPGTSAGPEELPPGEEELETVLDRLDEADLTAYAARTTTRDVEQLGFETVRVVVPTAQPMTFGEPYFGERAESVPESLGFAPEPDREHHPFP
jgi:ribosomal protein S12 methylthiotransferase accessory factor